MKGMPSSSRFLRKLLIITSLSVATLAQGQMILTSEVGGVSRAIVEVKDGRIWVESAPSPLALPESANWHLDGDLAKAAESLWLAPYHRLTQLAGDALQADPARPFRCVVSVAYPQGARLTPSLDVIWPKVRGREGIVVMAWVVDREITQVAVHAVSSESLKKGTLFESVFRLRAEEARGQPIMLFWQAGKFVSPDSRYPRAPARLAHLNASLNDAEALKNQFAKQPNTSKVGGLLYFAAQAGSIDAVDVLLEAGADQTAIGVAGYTPLHWAARNGRIEVVKALVKAGAEINPITEFEETPLMLAADGGHREVVRYLLEVGGRFNLTRSPRPRPRTEHRGDTIGSVRAFVDAFDQAERVIINLALRGHGDVVALLLSQNVHLTREIGGMTALHAAAYAGEHELVRRIIDAGLSPDLPNADGLTPLMWAAMGGRQQAVELLLEAGADPARLDKSGRTALHYAALADALAVTKALVAARADLASRDGAGATPLELALMSDAREVGIHLAQLDTTVDWRGPRGREVIDSVLRLDVPLALRAMLSTGLSAQFELAPGWPLSRIAQHYGSSFCSAALLEAGAPERAWNDSDGPTETQNRSRPEVTAVVVPMDPRNREADYPASEVRVSLVVGADGGVRFPKVVATPDRQLGSATRQAVAKWAFKPATEGAKPVSARLVLPISFASAVERREQAYVEEFEQLSLLSP